VPHWYKASHHLAFWNKYAWPDVKPKYDRGALTTWWYDPAKAAKLTAQ
jgi:microcin C transport system substrate-binding protein